jgi:hypothetical protein
MAVSICLQGEVLMSSAKEKVIYLPSKCPTSFDKRRMHAGRIDVLLCFRYPTELALGLGESCLGGGTLSKVTRVGHPVKNMFGTSPNLSRGFVFHISFLGILVEVKLLGILPK